MRSKMVAVEFSGDDTKSIDDVVRTVTKDDPNPLPSLQERIAEQQDKLADDLVMGVAFLPIPVSIFLLRLFGTGLWNDYSMIVVSLVSVILALPGLVMLAIAGGRWAIILRAGGKVKESGAVGRASLAERR